MRQKLQAKLLRVNCVKSYYHHHSWGLVKQAELFQLFKEKTVFKSVCVFFFFPVWVIRATFRCHPHGRGCGLQTELLCLPITFGMLCTHLAGKSLLRGKKVNLLPFKTANKTLKNFASGGASPLFSYSDIPRRLRKSSLWCRAPSATCAQAETHSAQKIWQEPS